MNQFKYKIPLIGLSLVLLASLAQAQDLLEEVDSLGANKHILKRARALDPNNKIKVVQNRAVDRDLRVEFGLNYGGALGGDPYLNTTAIGGQMDFHINPKWSVGVRYANYNNQLSGEGQRVLEEAQNFNLAGPDLRTAPTDSLIGTISWYPFYGKMNLFDRRIAQFDFYTLAGFGQTQLETGASAPTYSVGGGLGAWINQNISARVEVRYQGYQDRISDATRNIDWTVVTGTIGFML